MSQIYGGPELDYNIFKPPILQPDTILKNLTDWELKSL